MSSCQLSLNYLCACNQFKTKDKQTFIKHLQKCSPRVRSLFCWRCYEYNKTPDVLVKHIETDQCKPKPRSFNCAMCAFSTSKGVELREHIILKHKSALQSIKKSCETLDKTKSLPAGKLFDMKKEKLSTESSTNQNNVKFSFQMSDFPYRLKSYHAITVFMKEPNICNFFKCMSLKCTYSTDSPQHFTNHVEISHSGDKKYCIYCCLNFDCESLADHMVDVHGWRNHQCGECLYRCCNERYLTLHQISQHKGISKKFECNLLKEKVKDDKSEELQLVYCKEYSCTVQKCVFSTKDPVDFVKHLKRAHPSETKLSCALCTESATFVETAEEYVNHYYDSHNYDVYQCGHCYHGTRTLDGLWMHFSEKHPDVQPRIYKRTANDNDMYINCTEGEKMISSLISVSIVNNDSIDFKLCLRALTSTHNAENEILKS